MLDFDCNVFVRAKPISTCQPEHSLRMTTGADNSPTWTNYTPCVSQRTTGTSKFNHSGKESVDTIGYAFCKLSAAVATKSLTFPWFGGRGVGPDDQCWTKQGYGYYNEHRKSRKRGFLR